MKIYQCKIISDEYFVARRVIAKAQSVGEADKKAIKVYKTKFPKENIECAAVELIDCATFEL